MFKRNSNAASFSSNVATNVSSVVDSIFKKLPKNQYATLFSEWRSAVGEEFASIAAPLKVVIQNNKKILVLKSKKGRSIELQHSSQQILRKIHHFLGNDVFSLVKIVQLDGDDWE